MGMMDNLKQNFPFLAGNGGSRTKPAASIPGEASAQPSDTSDTTPPSGLNQKPAMGGIVRVGKKPVAVAIAVLCLGGVAMYVGLKEMGGPVHTTRVATVRPGTMPNVAGYVPQKKPKMPTQPGGQATNSGGQSAHSGQPSQPGQPARNGQPGKKNQQPSPQMKAAMASLSGKNMVAGSAPNPGNGSGASTGQQTTPAAHALAVSQGSAPGTGKVPQNKTNGESGKGVYDQHLVRRPASPYELMEGDVIPATLNTAINSNLAGRITATVSSDVYDTESGAYLLIPAGAQIVGMYSSKVLPGQGRVAVAWQRIVFPNGSYINLGSMSGSGQSGKAGMGGEVDNHTWLIFKNALLMSLIETGVSLAQPGYGGSSGGMMTPMSPGQIAEQNMGNTFGQAETQLMQRYITIPPTIKIKIGAQLSIIVSKDLTFPGVYNPAPAALPASGGTYAPATMINAYQLQGG
jgi:type IV secretion system protein VirB10